MMKQETSVLLDEESPKEIVNLRNSFNGIIEETRSSLNESSQFSVMQSQQSIYESMASLDNDDLEECFGLAVDAIMEDERREREEQLKSQQDMGTTCIIEESEEEEEDDEAKVDQVESPPVMEAAAPESPVATPSDFVLNSAATSDSPLEDSKPKRPLSAYNLYFQLERERILAGISPETPFTAEDVEKVAIERRILDNQPEKPRRKHRKSHGRISFAELARVIAIKWKNLEPDSKDLLQERAAIEKARYLRELEEWTKNSEKAKRDLEANAAPVDTKAQLPNHMSMTQPLQNWQIEQPSFVPPSPPMQNDFNDDSYDRQHGNYTNMRSEGLLGGDEGPQFTSFDAMQDNARFSNMPMQHNFGGSLDDSMTPQEAHELAGRTGIDPSNVMMLFREMKIREARRSSMMGASSGRSFMHENSVYQRSPRSGSHFYQTSHHEPAMPDPPCLPRRERFLHQYMSSMNQNNEIGYVSPDSNRRNTVSLQDEQRMSLVLSRYQGDYQL